MTEQLRVVIADDHPVVREGLQALIGSLPNVEVVASATDGPSAVRESVLHQPDVTLMDLHMPGGNGLDAIAELTKVAPGVGVLVLTMDEDEESVFAAMRLGARGYLLKGAGQNEIESAIRSVAAGQAIFGPGVAKRLLGIFTAALPQATDRPFPELTARETEVLELIARGESNPTIASTLVLSSKTVGNHISNIFAKLQVRDRAQAIVRARNAGLGRSSSLTSDPR